jgi:hypothetical protein
MINLILVELYLKIWQTQIDNEMRAAFSDSSTFYFSECLQCQLASPSTIEVKLSDTKESNAVKSKKKKPRNT